MSAARKWTVAAAFVAGVATVPLAAWSGRSEAAPAPPQWSALAEDDTIALGRVLAAVRGAPPLFCEMAARNVDGRIWWSMSGGVAGGALEVDSASASLIRWIQRSHADARVVPRLAAALRDPDACVRRIAGSMLGRVEHASAVTALLTALDDARADTRAVAAIGLGLGEDARAVQPLVRRLRDESAQVRRTAAWALGAIEDNAAMLPLIELLGRDTDARVRQAAAWAIGQVTG